MRFVHEGGHVFTETSPDDYRYLPADKRRELLAVNGHCMNCGQHIDAATPYCEKPLRDDEPWPANPMTRHPNATPWVVERFS